MYTDPVGSNPNMSSAVYFGYGNMAYQSNECIGKHFLTIRRKLYTFFKAWGASGADVKFLVENCLTNIDDEKHVICGGFETWASQS